MRRRVLLGFLVWCLAALAWQGGSRLAHPASGVWAEAPPVVWRHGHLAVLQLEQAVAAARPLIPAAAVVAFTSARDGDQYYHYHWAAYLLADRRVLDLRDVPDLNGVRYVLSDSQPAFDPRLALVRRLPSGFLLFRVRRRP